MKTFETMSISELDSLMEKIKNIKQIKQNEEAQKALVEFRKIIEDFHARGFNFYTITGDGQGVSLYPHYIFVEN